jgi:hypothetical protein
VGPSCTTRDAARQGAALGALRLLHQMGMLNGHLQAPWALQRQQMQMEQQVGS